MLDNLTIQGFNSLFTYSMCEVLQVLQDFYDALSTLLILILGISFVLNIFSLKNGLTIELRMRRF